MANHPTAPQLGRAVDSRRNGEQLDPNWVPLPAAPAYRPPQGDLPFQPKKQQQQNDGLVWAPWGFTEATPAVDIPSVAPFERETVLQQEKVEQLQEDPALARLALQEARKKARDEARARTAFVAAMPEFDGEPRAARRRRPKKEEIAQRFDASPPKRRLGRSLYDAVQTHGHFGMVDSGDPSCNGVRSVVCHVPKRSRGYILDIKQGEVIHANSGRGKAIGGRLDVQFVTRHQYFAPGRVVTSCVIGVPDWQWVRFVE